MNAITEHGGEVRFLMNKVEIFKNNKKVLEGIKKEHGLYVVKMKRENKEHAMILTTNKNSINT